VDPRKAAEDLTRRYAEALRRHQAVLQRRLDGAARGLGATPEQVQTRARNGTIEVVNAYIEGLRESLGHSDAGQRLELTIRNYVLGLQRVAEEAQRDVVDAVREYATTIRDLPTDVQQAVEQAYGDYAAGLQEQLERMEVGELTPEALLALGQSMTIVAMYTRAALRR
jgi:hypothetical protein